MRVEDDTIKNFDADYKRTEAALQCFTRNIYDAMTRYFDVSSRANTHVYRVFQIDRVRCFCILFEKD